MAGSRGSAKGRRRRAASADGRRWLWLGLELAALVATALIAAVAALGHGAERFAGVGLWASLLPFAAVTVVFGLGLAVMLQAWLRLRTWLVARAGRTALVASALAAAASLWATQPAFQRDLLRSDDRRWNHRGRAHDHRAPGLRRVPARRPAGARPMLERARPYEPTVHEAAAAFGLDPRS
jgi:hypothetical protein